MVRSTLRQLTAILPVLFLGTNLLPTLINVFHTLDRIKDGAKARHVDTETIFDYIVVGGGSAGCVLSSRLSEDADVKVLLLEAGGHPNPLHDIPLLTIPLLNRPHVDWRYFTEPQNNSCLAMNNNQCAWPRGKSLGGSSNLNFMIYARGFPKDYDNWANLTQDERWSYKNVLPFFKKSENYEGEFKNENYHSQGGPLNVVNPPFIGMADMFVQAGQELGYPKTDPSDEFQGVGFSRIHNTQKNGRRHSVYKAFVKPVRNRPNLFIYTFAHATQILFEGPENRAVGVTYFRHGKMKTAYAKREVIISSGALNSPQILMLSGIGPEKHLESMGIPVRLDLPVGQNLHDHVSSLIGPFIVDSPVALRLERDITPSAVTKFLTLGQGPLTVSISQATAFFPSKLAIKNGEADWPDLQYVFAGMSMGPTLVKELTRVFNVRQGIFESLFSEAIGKDSFQIMTILNRPLSRGHVRLESTDPFKPLIFSPNYLDRKEDLQVLVEGTKKAVQLVEETKTFKQIGGRLTKVPFPSCAHLKFRSDEYWECYHRQYSLTVWHPCCTAPMGRRGDPNAVVDSELRVYGTQNLRVIDTSIMPVIVAGNTNAPTVMVAEMGAHFIKMDALKKFKS